MTQKPKQPPVAPKGDAERDAEKARFDTKEQKIRDLARNLGAEVGKAHEPIAQPQDKPLK